VEYDHSIADNVYHGSSQTLQHTANTNAFTQLTFMVHQVAVKAVAVPEVVRSV
jgi:hypothetical protein